MPTKRRVKKAPSFLRKNAANYKGPTSESEKGEYVMNKHSAVQWVNEEIQQILRKKSFGPFETKEEVEKLIKNHAQKKNDGTVRLWVVIIKLKLACGKSRFYVIPTTDVPKWEDLIKKEDNISLFCIFFLKSLYLEESN